MLSPGSCVDGLPTGTRLAVKIPAPDNSYFAVELASRAD